MDIAELIGQVPKAELHLHIEGTLEPEMMMRLAQRNGVRIPYDSVEETRRAPICSLSSTSTTPARQWRRLIRRCLEDPSLVDRLVEEQIPLTVCPLSNVKLRVFDTLVQHNLAELLDTGLCVTVNSDDPAHVRGYIGDNFLQAQKALDLETNQLRTLARNAVKASFLSQDDIRRHVSVVDAVFDSA